MRGSRTAGKFHNRPLVSTHHFAENDVHPGTSFSYRQHRGQQSHGYKSSPPFAEAGSNLQKEA